MQREKLFPQPKDKERWRHASENICTGCVCQIIPLGLLKENTMWIVSLDLFSAQDGQLCSAHWQRGRKKPGHYVTSGFSSKARKCLEQGRKLFVRMKCLRRPWIRNSHSWFITQTLSLFLLIWLLKTKECWFTST